MATVAGNVRQGVFDSLGIALPVFAFGVGFGAAAAAAGLESWLVVSMSAVIFAGASQFAVLDLWHHPLPFLAMALVALAVNARHVILGATLWPKLVGVPNAALYSSLFVLSDVNWAATQARSVTGIAACGHLLGGGFVMWLSWNAGTLAGVVGGSLFGDLRQMGLDAIMPAFFLATLAGMVVDPRRDLPPWIISAAVAGVLCLVIPTHYAVLLATFVGGFYTWVRP